MRGFALALALVAMAATSCRRTVIPPRSFPSAAGVAINSGDFITSPGVYESVDNSGLPDQFVDFRLSITPAGNGLALDFYYEIRKSLRDRRINGWGTEPQTTGKVINGWFFYVEKPGAYWFFDGHNHVHLYGHGHRGFPTKGIITGNQVNRNNPKVPDAVLARLPDELSKRLFTPSGERPSF